ncbi:DUF1493 family protein [Bradyrhizobium sp. USDA 4353]
MTAPISDPLRQRVLRFVAQQTGAQVELFEQTDIALGVDGYDAEEFMIAFQRAFEVDLSGFKFDRHFGPEGFSLIGLILTALRFRHPPQPLTAGTLIDAARQKRWPSGTTAPYCDIT